MARTIAIPAATLLAALLVAGTANTAPPKDDVPNDEDLAKITGGKDKVELIDRLLTVIEKEIVPKTQKGVREGNKLFGGAVLKKSDLSTEYFQMTLLKKMFGSLQNLWLSNHPSL